MIGELKKLQMDSGTGQKCNHISPTWKASIFYSIFRISILKNIMFLHRWEDFSQNQFTFIFHRRPSYYIILYKYNINKGKLILSLECLSVFFQRKNAIYQSILPVVLYGCETWYLTLREESRLREFEFTILRRIFGPKRDENGEWRRLHNEELHSLYPSPNIVRVIKSRRLRFILLQMMKRLKVGWTDAKSTWEPCTKQIYCVTDDERLQRRLIRCKINMEPCTKQIYCVTDDERLERWLIRCKNNMEKTKQTLDLYFSLRLIAPELMLGWDVHDPWFGALQNVLYVLMHFLCLLENIFK